MARAVEEVWYLLNILNGLGYVVVLLLAMIWLRLLLQVVEYAVTPLRRHRGRASSIRLMPSNWSSSRHSPEELVHLGVNVKKAQLFPCPRANHVISRLSFPCDNQCALNSKATSQPRFHRAAWWRL